MTSYWFIWISLNKSTKVRSIPFFPSAIKKSICPKSFEILKDFRLYNSKIVIFFISSKLGFIEYPDFGCFGM